MNIRSPYMIPLGIFSILLVFLAVGLTLNPREVPSPLIGKPVPAFALPKLENPEHTLTQQDLVGRVALVNVWATWCGSCRAEHAVLLRLAQKKIVPIYGLDYKDQRDQALDWLAKLGNPYVTSGFDANGRVGIEWGVYGTPETFVIDQQGIIRYKHVGPLTDEVLEKVILPLVTHLKKPDAGS